MAAKTDSYVEKSFIRQTHNLGQATELDDRYETISTPDGFKGQLFPHQMTILRALFDVYTRRYLQVNDSSNSYNVVTTLPIIAQTSAIVLADSFGSGKTITIAAFILMMKRAPKALPERVNRMAISDLDYRPTNCWFEGFSTELTRRFERVLPPVLIVVGAQVLIQWQKALRDFTNLSVYTVGNADHMKKFYEEFKSGRMNRYDVVLLKNGTVTKNFLLDGENAMQVTGLRHMIDVVGKMTGNACWSLAVVDDFDTIKIDPNTPTLNALFTIYVSATRKEDHRASKVTTYGSFSEMLDDRLNTPLSRIPYDNVLFSNFRLRNTDKYIEQSTNIPYVHKYKYVYSNPDDNYMKLLGVMGESDANNLMEMLNGDAIETAAETLGIKTNSVADIFQRMLDKKYERYLHDQYVVETVQAARKHIKTLEEHPKETGHTAAEMESIRTQLTKRASADFIKYTSDKLVKYLKEMEDEFVRSREINAVAVNRVKDNLKQGECQVCTLPLEDMSVVINKCCGIVLCSECCTKASNIQKRQNYADKTASIAGVCPNCRAQIDVTKDIIFINKEFNLSALANARGDERPDAAPVVEIKAPVVDAEKELMDSIKSPKLKALLQIIKGQTPDNRSKAEMQIKNLIRGSKDVPQPKGVPRKVLVFAGFNESLLNIEKFLGEHRIEFMRLSGTYSQMNDVVEKFKKQATVLLVNSSQVCAGLNLQFATDLVFFHKLMDNNVEEQVCGRAQRIGREFNLQMHYLLYNNEKAYV